MPSISQPLPVFLFAFLGLVAFIGGVFGLSEIFLILRIGLKFLQQLGGAPDLVLIRNPNAITSPFFVLNLVLDALDVKIIGKGLCCSFFVQMADQSHVG